jgi:PKD repeat protein
MEPYNFAWNFGDNSKKDNKQNAVHTFGKAGKYNVTLAVTDSGSQNASDSLTVQVAEPEKQAPASNVSEGQAAAGNTTTANEAVDQNARLGADAGVDIVAKPGDTVVLGGKVTGVDPGKASYAWTQTSGPKVEISGADSLSPAVTVPGDIAADARAKFQLATSYGSAQDKDSMTLFTDYTKKIKNA